MKPEPTLAKQAFFVAGWIIVLLILALLTPNPANAQGYVVIGGGVSNIPHIAKDGYWYQEPLPHSFSETSATWKIGAGYRINKYLSVELDFMDLGRYQSQADWVPDSVYDPVGHKLLATGPINKLWGSGRSRGPAVLVVASLPMKRLTPFLRAGIYQSHYVWSVNYTDQPVVAGTLEWNTQGITNSTFYGIGMQSGNWSVEVDRFSKIVEFPSEPYPGFEKAQTVSLSYKFGF